jgi:hypothetical protein
MMFRLAAACITILQSAAFETLPAGPLSLRLSDRKVIAQPSRTEQKTAVNSDSMGQSFRIRGGIEDGGRAQLLVIPKNAKGKDVLLGVSVEVEKMGPREEDMWIRRVQVNGQWLKQKWSFKTGSGAYGDPSLYLARFGDSEWTSPVNLLKASDGLLSVAIHDKPFPTRMFQSSTAMDTQLVVGPVIVGVVWKTSNKDGLLFNHLDVHLSGLSQVKQELGGLLIGDPEEEEEEPDSPAANQTATPAPQESAEQPQSLAEFPLPKEHGSPFLPSSQLFQAVKADVYRES